MTFANLLRIFKRDKSLESTPVTFSDFFLNASEHKKTEVLTAAARLANEEQIKVFDRSRLKVKTN